MSKLEYGNKKQNLKDKEKLSYLSNLGLMIVAGLQNLDEFLQDEKVATLVGITDEEKEVIVEALSKLVPLRNKFCAQYNDRSRNR